MGKHFVARELLRGFAIEESPHMVWMYDRQKQEWRRPAIAKAAQAADYYSSEVEAFLAKYIEGPGHAALNRLRRGEPLTADQRIAMATYMAVSYSRSPAQAEKRRAMVPEILPQTIKKVRSAFSDMPPGDLRTKQLQEIERIEREYAEQLPPHLEQDLRHPHVSELATAAIARMTWRVVRAGAKWKFVTTDNPFFFFESLGMSRLKSEFTFPISSGLAIVGSQQGKPGDTIVIEEASSQAIKEINRRMVSKARRFIFAPEQLSWVPVVAAKASHRVTSIGW